MEYERVETFSNINFFFFFFCLSIATLIGFCAHFLILQFLLNCLEYNTTLSQQQNASLCAAQSWFSFLFSSFFFPLPSSLADCFVVAGLCFLLRSHHYMHQMYTISQPSNGEAGDRCMASEKGTLFDLFNSSSSTCGLISLFFKISTISITISLLTFHPHDADAAEDALNRYAE